jgi:hypothetical protein
VCFILKSIRKASIVQHPRVVPIQCADDVLCLSAPPRCAAMYLMMYLDEAGKVVYTLKARKARKWTSADAQSVF